MSTVDHPQTDGQAERVNRVLEDTLRSICAEAPRSWSDQLPMVEFVLNNSVHELTGFTPFYLNTPDTANHAGRSRFLHRKWGEDRKAFSSQVSQIESESLKDSCHDRLTLISRVRDAISHAQDKQKGYSAKHGRETLNVFNVGELVLLDTKNLPLKKVSSVESNNLKHRFFGTFAVLARHGAEYTIDLLKSITTRPTFYMGRLKRYHDPLGPPSRTEECQGENSPPRNEAASSGQPELAVSKPVTDTPASTHESHTKSMTVPNGKNSFLQGRNRNSAVNTPVELSGLTTKSVQILTKDLKGPRLASLSGSLITRSMPEGYLVNAIPKLTDLVAEQGPHKVPTRS
ncbi:Pol protein [Phytophthora palmivora]|uniref:Pol protein n=1 Tax=Phytophthora palmivora TaxID=4796 RepID=A0A2P4YFA0_9STRA|nr:Pol protein [Phytophthora palmivora]